MADFNPLWNVDGVEGFVSQDTHTGTTTNTHTGDDRLTYEDNGSDTLTNSGTDTDTRAVTTFDDVANFKNESRDSVAHGKVATDVKDLDGYKNQNYDSEMETEHDLLDEHVDMKIRQGNIGLTKSTDLLESNLDLYSNERFDFYRYIVRSCVNQVSYAVEGVL